MDQFTEEETVVGFVDTDSGGILITDMVWDLPVTSQQRISMDLDLEKQRIPIKAIRLEDGRKRLIIELDEATSYLQSHETVNVIDKPEKKEE